MLLVILTPAIHVLAHKYLNRTGSIWRFVVPWGDGTATGRPTVLARLRRSANQYGVTAF